MPLSKELIINCALTGIVPTKFLTPHVPITPEEIATDTLRVYKLGASIVHIHARDKNGVATHKKDIYQEIILRIREKCSDILISVSTSGRRQKDIQKRLEVLELDGDAKPDMASVTLGSMNFIREASVNSPENIVIILKRLKEVGIKPEFEIFDTGMASYSKYMQKKGFIDKKCYANLLLGSLGTMSATPKNLIHLIEELPYGSTWAASGIGRFAFQTHALSIAIGGGVRVGIEDCIYMDTDKTLATNTALVSRVVELANTTGRKIMSAETLRNHLDINPAKKLC